LVDFDKKSGIPAQGQMHEKVRIKTGHGIIEDYSESAFHLTVYFSGGRRLYYIEKAEKKKSGEGVYEGKGDQDHRDEKANNFVDHDSGTVLLRKNYFGPFRNPSSEYKESRRSQEIYT
jgi:hypothetical protein